MRTSICEYGAIADGRTPATQAFAAAIAAVHDAGGGTVVVPPGQWRSAMIRLRDRVELHLERGAVVEADPDPEAHRPLLRSAGGSGDHWHRENESFHLVVAQGCTSVAITGAGRLDGNGQCWYNDRDGTLVWPLAIHDDWRRMGALVLITECTDVRIEGVTLGNVGNWTLHLHHSRRIQVRGICIDNPADAPNADGIDITGCQGVTISDCHIDTCDDAICLKTMPESPPCEDVVVTNCVLRSDCAALKLGCGESFQPMRNVAFSNCTVRGSHRAVALYSYEGAVIENVSVDNIVCDTRAHLMFARPIHMDLRRKRPQSRLGAIRNVRISGLMAETNGRCLLTAEPGAYLEDIVLRDVLLRYPLVDDPATCGADYGGGQFSQGNPWARIERAAMVAEGVRGLLVDNFRCRWPNSDTPAPAEWQWTRKVANGTQRTFSPADWTLATDIPFAAFSGRRVSGLRLDREELQGHQGGQAVLLSDCD